MPWSHVLRPTKAPRRRSISPRLPHLSASTSTVHHLAHRKVSVTVGSARENRSQPPSSAMFLPACCQHGGPQSATVLIAGWPAGNGHHGVVTSCQVLALGCSQPGRGAPILRDPVTRRYHHKPSTSRYSK